MIPKLLTKLREAPFCLLSSRYDGLAKQLLQAEKSNTQFILPRATMFADDKVGPCWGDGEPMIPQLEIYGACALIQVRGVLASGVDEMDCFFCGAYDYEWISEQIEMAMEVPGVKNICIAWDSPGGSTIGMESCAEDIADATSAGFSFTHFSGGMVCSAAYRLTLGGELLVTRDAQVGCIGAIYSIIDDSAEGTMEGRALRSFTSDGAGGEAPIKTMGMPYAAVTEEIAAFMAAKVNEAAAPFHAAMLASRPKAQGVALRGGWEFGTQAVANGLADFVADDLEEVVGALAVGNDS